MWYGYFNKYSDPLIKLKSWFYDDQQLNLPTKTN